MPYSSIECRISGKVCEQDACLQLADKLETIDGSVVIDETGCAGLALVHLVASTHDRPIESFAKQKFREQLGIVDIKVGATYEIQGSEI